jgi:serpin B
MAELPYQGEHMAMDILLPSTGALDPFRQGLDDKTLSSMLNGLHDSTLELHLPKFTFDDGATLNDALAKLGMRTLFSPSADLSGIPTNGERLQIGAVVEKTHVAVDEDGTTAAAAAGAAVGTSAIAPITNPVVMNVDHPFLFLIRDTVSGQILFLGQVTHPKA